MAITNTTKKKKTTKTSSYKEASKETTQNLNDARKEYDSVQAYTQKVSKPTANGLQNAQQQYANLGEYKSPYQDNIAGLADKISNRKAFEYDPVRDANYQALLKQYQASGKLAMEDAMANAAALSGGFGNSYAQTVGQQQYNAHVQQAANQIPALQQAAFEMWKAQGDDLYNQMGMYQGLDDTAYGRHQDRASQLMTDRDYWQGVYDNENAMNYQMYQDNLAKLATNRDYWQGVSDNEKAFNYQEYTDELARAAASKSSGSGSSGGSKKSSANKTENNTSNKLAGTGDTNNLLGGNTDNTMGNNAKLGNVEDIRMEAFSRSISEGGRDDAYNYINEQYEAGNITYEEATELVDFIKYGNISGQQGINNTLHFN